MLSHKSENFMGIGGCRKWASVRISIDDSAPQIPFSAPPFYPDPEYPVNSYRISKPCGITALVTVSAI
jgi:hypothetical protein